jgi:hypothetical protein
MSYYDSLRDDLQTDLSIEEENSEKHFEREDNKRLFSNIVPRINNRDCESNMELESVC